VLILGIESSCDETGVAVVQTQKAGYPKLVAHTLHSQIAMHKTYGGVVPELASRDHIRYILPLLRTLLDDANCTLQDIDILAYTQGPGLAGPLLVGAGVTNALATAMAKPVMGIHHLEGHLLSPFLEEKTTLKFPFLALLVSGGHTQLMQVENVGTYLLLGETIDDAAGEAFDKSAKIMGIDYPGGATLSSLAKQGNPLSFSFPRPILNQKHLDFSFSGLKTAIRLQVDKISQPIEGKLLYDLAASIQEAIVEVLVKKTLKALDISGLKRLVIAGGVAANMRLRGWLDNECKQRNIKTYYPDPIFCTDNGAMIALAAAMRFQAKTQQPHTDYAFCVHPRWNLYERTFPC
jgi:N6-L-threonylcarbamoyladenine synthase